MANKVVSITVSVDKATEMMDFYRAYQKVNDGEYIIFQASYSGTTITIYQDKKNKHKVVFMGEDALLEAKKWDLEAEAKEKTTL